MKDTAFVLGNGTSRKGIKIADLQEHGTVFACNAVFRTETPDYLVAVDPKMIYEIGETDYPAKHQVWSNFNHQYNKKPNILDHVNWFKPSLGWSSGPTALKMAADKDYKTIYILGFDFIGIEREEGKNRFKLNNLFGDSRNYKRSVDEATFYGNWMNQTKRVLRDYDHIQFRRVVGNNSFKPHDLEFNKNFKHIDIEKFLKIYNLTQQK
jgi:hypothetical protein